MYCCISVMYRCISWWLCLDLTDSRLVCEAATDCCGYFTQVIYLSSTAVLPSSLHLSHCESQPAEGLGSSGGLRQLTLISLHLEPRTGNIVYWMLWSDWPSCWTLLDPGVEVSGRIWPWSWQLSCCHGCHGTIVAVPTQCVMCTWQALGLRRDDTFSTTMLNNTVEQLVSEMAPCPGTL